MELNKAIKRIGKICLWTSVCLLVIFILLYFARIPLSISLLESSGESQNASVDCLEWNLTLAPSLQISEICISSDKAKLEAINIDWPFWGQTLDIQQLTVTHLPSKTTAQTDDPQFNIDSFTLPTNLPLIHIDSLLVDSYLLEKPLALSIQQDAHNSLLVTGDIDANINLIESDSGNSLQAKVTWIPAKLISAIPQLKATMVDVDRYFAEQLWKQTPISSEITVRGSKFTSSHTLSIQEQLNYASCNTDISVTGRFETVTSTETQITLVNLDQLPIRFALDDCEKLTILSNDLAIKSLTLLAEDPIKVTASGLEFTNLTIRDSLVPTKLQLVLQNAEFPFDEKQPRKGQFQAMLDMPYKSSIAEAKLNALIAGEFKIIADELHISVQTDNFKLDKLSLKGESNANTDIVNVSAKGQYHSGIFEATGNISSESISIEAQQASAQKNNATALIKRFTSQFQVTESTVEEIRLELNNKFSTLSYDDVRIAQVTNQTSAILTDLHSLDITASSEISKSQFADVNVKSISIEHNAVASIRSNDNQFTSEGTHAFRTDSGVFGNINHVFKDKVERIDIQLPEQNVMSLQSLLTNINRQSTLKSGRMAGSLQYDLATNQGLGSLLLKELDMDYDEYKIRGVNMDEEFTVSSAELQLPNAKVSINSIDVGVPVNNISMVIAAQQNRFKLLESKGSIFGGQFMLGEFWLDGRDQELKISATDLSLAELAALQQQSGINVTGEVGGDLPLLITAGEFKIDNGTLTSERPGKLRITDNPAFDSIKESQQQLALLENLDYEKLQTNVTLTPDGWLKLGFSILGKNPDKNQAVNFNYGHEENIFTLLKALRITNSVQQGIEKKIEDKFLDKK